MCQIAVSCVLMIVLLSTWKYQLCVATQPFTGSIHCKLVGYNNTPALNMKTLKVVQKILCNVSGSIWRAFKAQHLKHLHFKEIILNGRLYLDDFVSVIACLSKPLHGIARVAETDWVSCYDGLDGTFMSISTALWRKRKLTVGEIKSHRGNGPNQLCGVGRSPGRGKLSGPNV